MSSCQYVENAVKIVKGILAQEGMKPKGKADCPYSQHYRPEADVSQELEPFLGQCYQKLIGILHWMVVFGCIDVITEVSLLSAHNVMPHEGQLETVYHIFMYLIKHECSRIVFDDVMPEIDE
jgi:hypothetical protein